MILVLGDSCSIGLQTLQRLRSTGHGVRGVSRRSKDLALDVLTESGLRSLFLEAQQMGPITGVVQFIGGRVGTGKTAELSDTDWLKTFELNVLSTVRLARTLGPLLQQGATWINVSSAMVRAPSVFDPHYAAAKAALEAVTRSLAQDWSERGIRVLTLRLGAIDAQELRQREFFNEERVRSRIALGRLGTPDDVANMVRFLLSAEASWVSGHVIDLDGGTGLR